MVTKPTLAQWGRISGHGLFGGGGTLSKNAVNTFEVKIYLVVKLGSLVQFLLLAKLFEVLDRHDRVALLVHFFGIAAPELRAVCSEHSGKYRFLW